MWEPLTKSTGTRNDSRIEYGVLPGRRSVDVELTVSFRTGDRHGGLLFYAAGDGAPEQFLALYMKDARLHLAFNCGGETALIASLETYNANLWLMATVSRNCLVKMSVDRKRGWESYADCSDAAPLAAPYYFGGLRDTVRHLSDFYQPFKGCLRGLMMNGQYVTEVQHRVNAFRCTDNIEGGVYFGPSTDASSNYLKIESIRVVSKFYLSMYRKPRNSTGLLLSAHGDEEFLVVELLENEVIAYAENIKIPFHASYKLNNDSLYDGNWHQIIVGRTGHEVAVSVDGNTLGIGRSHYHYRTSFINARFVLYIGGHDRAVSSVRGTQSKRGFTGCIRDISISHKPVPIPPTVANRDTHIGVCPAD